MDKALFYHIADVIQELHHIDYQVITLRNYRNQYCWQKPHIWKVNEHDLAEGVRKLIQRDPAAKCRADNLLLTCMDVEYIILKATFDILKLELYEFEY